MFAGSERFNFWHALTIWSYFKHTEISKVVRKIEVGSMVVGYRQCLLNTVFGRSGFSGALDRIGNKSIDRK